MIWTFLTFIVTHILWLYIQDSEFSSSYNKMIFKYQVFHEVVQHYNFLQRNKERKREKEREKKAKDEKENIQVCVVCFWNWFDIFSSWTWEFIRLGLFLVLPFICELCFLEKVDVPAVKRLQINSLVLSFVGYCFQSILVKQPWCRTLASH